MATSRTSLAFGFTCVSLLSLSLMYFYMEMDSDKVFSWKKYMDTTTSAVYRDGVREKIKRVRLLCWVMTMLRNINTKTVFVKKTWGKRCDILLFFGSQEDKDFPVIGVNVSEGRAHLSEKTYAAFRYIHEHYFDRADWFMKADDDTYVVVDNLKYFLSGLNTSEGQYMGFTFSGQTPQGYNGGGAGYVLSKEALRRFGKLGNNTKLCPYAGGIEDVDMGRCMHHLGVKNVNTLDAKKRTRFHSYHPLTHMLSSDPYLTKKSSYGYRTGAQNISSYPFTFHYIKGAEMDMLEFYLYHIKHVSDEGTVLL